MALEIVPGTEVQTQVGAAKIDPSSFRRAALARGEVAGGLGQDVGSILNEVSGRMQQLRNSTHIMEADIAVKDFNEKQQEALRKNPNPDTWAESYKQNFKEFTDGYMAAHPQLGPDVRNHVTNMFTQSQARMDVNLRTAANIAEIKHNKEVMLMGSEQDIYRLHPDEAKKKYDVGLANGAINKYEYENLMSQLPKKTDIAAIENGLNRDPIHTHMLLTQKDKDGNPVNFKNIIGEDRDSITAKSFTRMRTAQGENADKLKKTIENKPLGEATRLIKEQENQGNISSARATAMLNSLSKEYVKFENDAYNLLRAQLLKADFSKEKEPKNWIEDFNDKAANLNPIHEAELVNAGREKLNKFNKPELSEEAKNIAANKQNVLNLFNKSNAYMYYTMPEVIMKDKEYNWIQRNILGKKETYKLEEFKAAGMTTKTFAAMTSEDVEKYFGKGVTKEQVMLYSDMQKSKIMTDMAKWFDDPKNPDRADMDKAMEHLNKLTRPHALSATTMALGLGQSNQ